MYWRIGNEYRKRPRESNKADFRRVVEQGPPPGLLAFDADLAVGWCQLTPRDGLPWLDRAWRLRRVDDVPVWSISCFYVRKGYVGVDCGRSEDRKECRGAGARSLSSRCRFLPQRIRHRLCFHVRARWFQGSRSPHAASPHHAS
jgi:hypothetical protein